MNDSPSPTLPDRRPAADETPADGWSAQPNLAGFVAGVRSSVTVADLVVAAEVGFLIAATGVLTGLIWAWAGPHGVAEMTSYGPVRTLPYNETAFAGEGVFGLIGMVSGALAGVLAYSIGPARRHRGPVLLLGVALGSLGAAWIASRAGGSIGLHEFQRLLNHAPMGRRFRMPMKLTASGLLLIQPLVAAAAYMLLAAWSPHPQLRAGDPASEPETLPAVPESPAAGTP